jgi:hypothetical protein
VQHLVLPPPPSDKLDLEVLDQVAGGFCCGDEFYKVWGNCSMC